MPPVRLDPARPARARRRALHRLVVIPVAIAIAGLAGCSRDGPAPAARPPAEEPRTEEPRRPAVVFLGDSLTAGYGLAEEQAYPALVEDRMRVAGIDLPVVNAGVSGDTTAGGLRRLDWILRQPVALLFVALGGNDGLRGVPPEETRRNLARIIERGQAAGARVVLAGLKLPVNYGPRYRAEFEALYADLARRRRVVLVPFLLEGVGGVAALNQADGIHPTAEGQARVAEVVWPILEPVLREAAREAAASRAPLTTVR